MDAIALLKADHKQVAEWFEQFEPRVLTKPSKPSHNRSAPH
jgi:hypothetical protein